jgi:hypothetical protein
MIPDYRNYSLEQLAAAIGEPDSRQSHAIEIEFLRRQTSAQQEAMEAQRKAANAAIEMAAAIATGTRYLMVSMIVLAASAAGIFIVSLVMLPRR